MSMSRTAARSSGITVAVPCHNAERFLEGCVRAIINQTLRPVEILVVDDGSTDRTRAIAEGLPVRIVGLDGHPGLAAARNAAFAAARTGLVAAIDVDCVADPTWLERLLGALESSKAAGAGGRLVEAHRTSLGDLWRAVHMRQDWGSARLVNPPFLFGCNTLFRKEAVEAVGGYDPRFRTNGEDVDLSRRLMHAGHTLVYEPSAIVTHLKRDTVLSVLRADWRWGYAASGETMKYEHNGFIVYHNWLNARYRAGKDVAARRWRLLPVDLLLFFRHTCLDLRHAAGLRRSRAVRVGASRRETFTRFLPHLAELSRTLFLRNPDEVAGAPSPGGDAP
ncbi:MAG: glycosyltransferase [bacterium]|nr:glycosyltransferase [bacterium]